jgi:hypothetical protein
VLFFYGGFSAEDFLLYSSAPPSLVHLASPTPIALSLLAYKRYNIDPLHRGLVGRVVCTLKHILHYATQLLVIVYVL